MLYAIHEEHGAQPETTILEAINILNDDYSTEEVEEAALRLEKIKKIESRGRNESEDSIPLMKILWLQLVKALLLQKDDKNHPLTPTTFEGTRG